MLGAAVLILTLLSVIRLGLIRPVSFTAMAFTVRVTDKRSGFKSTCSKFWEFQFFCIMTAKPMFLINMPKLVNLPADTWWGAGRTIH